MAVNKVIAPDTVPSDDDQVDRPADDIVWIEYEDMTDAQRRIVDAGDTVAGEIPLGLSSEERFAWLMEWFGGRRGE